MKMFALKESHAAQCRASAGCRGALGLYLKGEALRVNIILIPQSPSQVRAERKMDSRKYGLVLT